MFNVVYYKNVSKIFQSQTILSDFMHHL